MKKTITDETVLESFVMKNKDNATFVDVMYNFFGVIVGPKGGLTKDKSNASDSPIQEGHVAVTYKKKDVNDREIEEVKVIDTMQIIFDYVFAGGIKQGKEEGIYEVAIRKWLGDEVTNVEIGGKDILKFHAEPIATKDKLDMLFDCVEFFFRNPGAFSQLIPASSSNKIDSERILAMYTGKTEIYEMFGKITSMADPERSYKTYGMDYFKRTQLGKEDEDKTWFIIAKPLVVVKYGTDAWKNIKTAMHHKTSKSGNKSFHDMKQHKVEGKYSFCVLNSYKYVDIGGVTQPKTDTIVNMAQFKLVKGKYYARYVGDLKFSLKKQNAKRLEGGSLLQGKGIAITSTVAEPIGNANVENLFKKFAVKNIEVSPRSPLYNGDRSELISKIEIVKFSTHITRKDYWAYSDTPMMPFMAKVVFNKNIHTMEDVLKESLKNDDNTMKVASFIRALYGGLAESYIRNTEQAYGDWEANVYFEYDKEFNSFNDIIMNFKIIPSREFNPNIIATREFVKSSLISLCSYVVRIKYAKTTKDPFLTAKACERKDKEPTIKEQNYSVLPNKYPLPLPREPVYFPDATIGAKGLITFGRRTEYSKNWQDVWDKSIGARNKNIRKPPAFRNDRDRALKAGDYVRVPGAIFYVIKFKGETYVYGHHEAS